MFTIEHNFDDLIKNVTDVEKRQIPFALSLSLNNTAKLAKTELVKEMRDVFDRPTPYILSSVFVKPSNKRNLTAIVGLKDTATKAIPASKILTPQIVGGSRRLKRYEVALRSIGVLPSNYFTVPGEGAKMDQYGNMSRGQIIQILSYFNAFGETGFRANATDKTRARLRRGTKKTIHGISYFAIQPGDPSHLEPGVWMRVHSGFGTAIRPVLIFVERVFYDAIFDFKFTVQLTHQKHFSREFMKALRKASATARKR